MKVRIACFHAVVCFIGVCLSSLSLSFSFFLKFSVCTLSRPKPTLRERKSSIFFYISLSPTLQLYPTTPSILKFSTPPKRHHHAIVTRIVHCHQHSARLVLKFQLFKQKKKESRESGAFGFSFF